LRKDKYVIQARVSLKSCNTLGEAHVRAQAASTATQ